MISGGDGAIRYGFYIESLALRVAHYHSVDRGKINAPKIICGESM
jgi:hypothetical protein